MSSSVSPAVATAFAVNLASSSGTVGDVVPFTVSPVGGVWPADVFLMPAVTGFSNGYTTVTPRPTGTMAAQYAFPLCVAATGTLSVSASGMNGPAAITYQAKAAGTSTPTPSPTPTPAPAPAPAPTETGALSGVPTAGTAGTALATSGTFSLTNAPSSGTTAYVGLFNVTAGAYQGALQAVTGSSGSLPTLTPASAAGAATYAVRLCADSAGATVLATSPNIAVSAAAPAPGQVTGLTLSATSSSISASWNAPTSGAAVTAYKKQYRAVGSTTWNTNTRNVTGSSSDLLANFYIGISPDTDYEVVITAIAAGVEGAPSATVATHTLVVPAPPGPTTALTAGSITSTSAFLSWTAPTSGGVPNGYQVEDRTPPGSGAWVDPVGIGGAVSFTKTGLSPSTTYEFHVFAYNDGGSGTPSAPITITTAA